MESEFETPPPGGDRLEAESEFATPASIIEDAFDQIMLEVDAPDDAKAKLRPLFVRAHRSGKSRLEVEAIDAILRSVEWGEIYFGAWRERFRSQGSFPYMWNTRGKALISEAPRRATTIEDAVGYLRVVDMRRILVDLGAMPEKGRPRKRAEFIALLSAAGKVEQIVDAAEPAFRGACKKWERDRETAKCELLAHTVAMRAYALRDRQNRERLWGARRLRAMGSDCPVETAYASKYFAGEIDNEPPFFPGDRTSLIVELEDDA